jgi:hypothetical protein
MIKSHKRFRENASILKQFKLGQLKNLTVSDFILLYYILTELITEISRFFNNLRLLIHGLTPFPICLQA